MPPSPRGVPQIEVTFAIDSNGIVNVSARDMATNKSQGVQINPAGGLTKEEIDRLVEDADKYVVADRQRREIRRLKNRLEGVIYTNDRVFEQFQEMLDPEERKRIRNRILKARMALANDDRADLETAMFDLNAIARQLSELMLDQVEDASKGGAG